MPYADKDKQKAYVRDWAREYQRRKKAERIILEQHLADLQQQNRYLTKKLELCLGNHTHE
jgi:hypothetical protein